MKWDALALRSSLDAALESQYHEATRAAAERLMTELTALDACPEAVAVAEEVGPKLLTVARSRLDAAAGRARTCPAPFALTVEVAATYEETSGLLVGSSMLADALAGVEPNEDAEEDVLDAAAADREPSVATGSGQFRAVDPKDEFTVKDRAFYGVWRATELETEVRRTLLRVALYKGRSIVNETRLFLIPSRREDISLHVVSGYMGRELNRDNTATNAGTYELRVWLGSRKPITRRFRVR